MTEGGSPPPERARGIALFVLAATMGTLFLGYSVKSLCTRHNWDGYQYRTSCYNDIFALYSFRGWEQEPIPYVHGDGVVEEREVGDLEYPVLTGMLIAAVALIASNGFQFFHLTAAALAVLGVLTGLLLLGLARDRRRALAFALAPSLALYAFHNWDLLAVALMCAGLLAYRARMDGAAGALLGLGAAAKLFPGLLVPALMLARHRSSGRWPLAMPVAAALTFIGVNLPFALANLDGWLTPWVFQSSRAPNFETSWYAILYWGERLAPSGFWFDDYPAVTGVASALLFGFGLLALLARARRRPPRPYALCFAVLLLFLLTAKVFSPQFSLWLLPFLVLVRVPVPAMVAFFVADAAVWFSISNYFIAASGPRADTPAMYLVQALVLVRYVVLGWLLWIAMRADENVDGDPGEREETLAASAA